MLVLLFPTEKGEAERGHFWFSSESWDLEFHLEAPNMRILAVYSNSLKHQESVQWA